VDADAVQRATRLIVDKTATMHMCQGSFFRAVFIKGQVVLTPCEMADPL